VSAGLAPSSARAPAPRSVAVLRALMLGDLLCATPALRAMRAAWPQARITLVGLPWAAEWARRSTTIDDFEPFPGWPGLPEQAAPTAAQAGHFLARMRARQPDLAIQLHGSGGQTNALVARFGARRLAGFHAPNAAPPAGTGHCFVPWPQRGHEIERLLTLTDALGLPRRGTQLDWPLRPQDHRHARELLPSGGPFALVHPGSQWPSRRWPPERFAALADWLSQQGLGVVLSGTAGEAELTAAVAAHMKQRPLADLAGRTDLWTLGGLVGSASLLVCNDTGLSHIAAALNTPSVVVACGSEVERWAPLQAERHPVLWQDLECRPCAHPVCPVGHACAQAISVAAVARAASGLLRREALRASAPA